MRKHCSESEKKYENRPEGEMLKQKAKRLQQVRKSSKTQPILKSEIITVLLAVDAAGRVCPWLLLAPSHFSCFTIKAGIANASFPRLSLQWPAIVCHSLNRRHINLLWGFTFKMFLQCLSELATGAWAFGY